jgi:hypothetical protein
VQIVTRKKANDTTNKEGLMFTAAIIVNTVITDDERKIILFNLFVIFLVFNLSVIALIEQMYTAK